MNAADEGEILSGGQIVEKRQVLGDDAHPALRLQRLAGVEHVPTQDDHLTAGRGEQAGEHLDRCRLPRAIGSEEAVECPALDGQIDATDGARVIEESSQLVRFDSQGHGDYLLEVLVDGPDNSTAKRLGPLRTYVFGQPRIRIADR